MKRALRTFCRWFTILLIVGLGGGVSAAAAEMTSEDCLGCHSDAEVVGEGAVIAEQTFAATPHASMGCPACHRDVGDGHPDDGLAIGSSECRGCHNEVAAEYGASPHHSNADCADCHNPHAVRGQHEVSGYDMNRQCAGCHPQEEMTERHRKWLPQTGVHLAALPCISCHTGSEKLALELYLIREGRRSTEGDFELADAAELSAMTEGGQGAGLVDLDGDQRVSVAELRDFNRNSDNRRLRLHGMMVPARMTHDYDILYNRWDCSFCHGTGPDSLQSCYLSLPAADGNYHRLPVEKGAVMSVLYTTPDFYMVGATRNMALNLLGAMILAGGLVMPVGHGLLRFLTRKNRR
jgi:hypothetical protein